PTATAALSFTDVATESLAKQPPVVTLVTPPELRRVKRSPRMMSAGKPEIHPLIVASWSGSAPPNVGLLTRIAATRALPALGHVTGTLTAIELDPLSQPGSVEQRALRPYCVVREGASTYCELS